MQLMHRQLYSSISCKALANVNNERVAFVYKTRLVLQKGHNLFFLFVFSLFYIAHIVFLRLRQILQTYTHGIHFATFTRSTK